MSNTLKNHKIVSEQEWLESRKVLLAKEKELTRLNDELSQMRRELPWVKVNKPYVFDGPEGKETLADLFGNNSQLIIYHFMFAPGWKEGCVGCSFLSDHFDGPRQHLENHDVSLVVVSRAPYPEFQDFKKRMGWTFKWVSSNASDFNFDYHVSFKDEEIAKGKIFYNYQLTEASSPELHGTSVFYKNEKGEVFHTYSSYERGNDVLVGAHSFLDLTPKGRNEEGTMNWVRHHDKYENSDRAKGCCCNSPKI